MNSIEVIAQSPGRINIIGEHTDYNNGYVLPAAIDKKTTFQLKKNNTPQTVNLYADNIQEQFSFNLASFKPQENGWPNYLMGVVHELQKIGCTFSGFEGRFEGDVPIGGGMSSSASLECSLAYGLNQLFDLQLEKWQMIKACQMAEHNFVGIKCGIMDQFASMMGKKDHVMLLDCQTLEFNYFPLDLGDYQLLLLNTNVAHSLASSEYNLRRAACEEGVTLLQKDHKNIRSLRDISYKEFSTSKDKLPDLIAKRCRHVILENGRVLLATQALKKKNFHKLGELIYQSHNSLQNDYEVSCEELDFLVQLTKDKEYILGSRMMGGGFGGCTLNIINKHSVDKFIDIATTSYRQQFGIDLSPYSVFIENGSSIVGSV